MRKYAGAVIGCLLAILSVGTVLAEGSFDSFITGAHRGFDSRTWVDRDNDNANTTVRFDTCRDTVANGANDWAKVSLQRMRLILPAENRGTKTLNCWVSATGNWGDQPASDYQFQLEDYSGGAGANVLNVGFVRVTY